MTSLRYSTATLSHAGGRSYNEDCLGFHERANGGCWVLADGLGGHGGGEVAAEIAVQTLLQFDNSQNIVAPDQILAAFEQADATIRARQETEPRLSRMRSTLAALVCHDGHAFWAHLGDTRIYFLRNSRIHFQTADHSVPWALVRAGEITLADVRHHEDRNRLLRTLGNDKGVRPDISTPPDPLQPGDAFLLCTDGLWEYVTEAEMEITFTKSKAPADWLGKMETILLNNCSDDHDNYSALAVMVQ